MVLKEFYKKIDRKIIEQFVEYGQEEHLTLDFITVNSTDLKHSDDKQNFAKALSGFANSSGGVIVWGVVAKRNKGIDCTFDVREIQPLKQLISRLNQLTGELVSPVVEGVIHRKIETSNDNGFVKTLIPESDSGPHMAKGGTDRYYKRSGDSFRRMEHFDIEDMFGRRKKPKLSLCIDLRRGAGSSGPSGERRNCDVIIGIKNDGRGIAKNVALAIGVNQPYRVDHIDHSYERYGFHRLKRPGSDKDIIVVGADTVIHPKSSITITKITFQVAMTAVAGKEVMIDAEIMAENMRTVEQSKVVSWDEIRVATFPPSTELR